MTVRVGVIGVGTIGQDHIRRLSRKLANVTVVGIADVDRARAQSIVETLPGARVYENGHAVIAAADVDGVLVATWGAAHEEYVLGAIEQGKPVFCEKPLAPTVDACQRAPPWAVGTPASLRSLAIFCSESPRERWRSMRRTKQSGLGTKQAAGTRFRRLRPEARIRSAAFHEVILPAMEEEPPVLVKRGRMASESSMPHGKLHLSCRRRSVTRNCEQSCRSRRA